MGGENRWRTWSEDHNVENEICEKWLTERDAIHGDVEENILKHVENNVDKNVYNTQIKYG